MRTFVLTMVAAMAATSATAMDLPVPGLQLNTEAKAFYKADAESTHATVEPELNWQPIVDGPINLTAGALISVYDSTATDSFTLADTFTDGSYPTLDLGAYYDVTQTVQAYGETSWDFNTEKRGEIEIGVALNF